MLCCERIKPLGTQNKKKRFYKSMPIEALKKELNHVPWLEKKKKPELIHYFFHLVMMRKMWMSFFYGVANDFVDDDEQDEEDPHQGELGNLRKLARAPMPSTRYPPQEYVKLDKVVK